MQLLKPSAAGTKMGEERAHCERQAGNNANPAFKKITGRILLKSQACHKSIRKKKKKTNRKKRENHLGSLYISLMGFAPAAPVFQCFSVTLPCSFKQRLRLCYACGFQAKPRCQRRGVPLQRSPNTRTRRAGPKKTPFCNPETSGRHLHGDAAKVSRGARDAAGP